MKMFLLMILWGNFQSDSLRLEECHQLAVENYPITRQQLLYEDAHMLKMRNLEAKHLPQFTLNGQATYQSAVVKVPIRIPNAEIPSPPKDQYKVSLDVNQVLYDGGVVRYGKESEKVQLAGDQKGIEVEHQNLKARVNSSYFSVLLYQQNEALLDTTLQILNAKQKQMETRLRSGVILQSELSKIKAEILKTLQKKTELKAERLAHLQVLGNLIGMELQEPTVLAIPNLEINIPDTITHRPEIALFELQFQRLAINEKLVNAGYAPKLSVFGQGGYGRPNPFNFFDQDGDFFYLMGAKVSWNIWNWNTTAREKELLKVQSQMINTQKETFDLNLENALTKDLADIWKLEELLINDLEIIKLQTEIATQSSTQLDNGVITATDYLTDVNEESRAKLTRNLHEVQLAQAKINYLTNRGKL